MPVTLEVDEGDLREALEALLYDVRVAILTDLLNTIEQNLLDIGHGGGQLFRDILIDFEKSEIHVNAPWSGYVEFGTVGQVKVPRDPYSGGNYAGPVRSPGRKGPPPKEPIEKWVKDKLRDADIERDKRGRRKPGAIKRLSEQIRWKIYWFGTEPQPFVRNALDEIRNKYDNAVITLEIGA